MNYEFQPLSARVKSSNFVPILGFKITYFFPISVILLNLFPRFCPKYEIQPLSAARQYLLLMITDNN